MMEPTTEIQLLDPACSISIDRTQIDVSEVESDADKAFLMEHGAEILTIQAKTDHAIKQVIATIQGRASLAMGKVIAEVQDRFHERDSKGSGLQKWYASVGLEPRKACGWANAFRATKDFQGLFDGLVEPEKVLACSDKALSLINNLPASHKEEILAEVAVGNPPTTNEIIEISKKPEVKLSKAQELLQMAKIRKADADQAWEEVKADPLINSSTTEYRNDICRAPAAP